MIRIEPAIALLKRHLDELSPVVVSEMKEIIKNISAWWNQEDTVVFYRFTVHADGHHVTFGDMDLYQGALSEPFMNAMHLVPESMFPLDFENITTLDEMETAFETYQTAQAEIFFSWFADCFIKAGGQKLEKAVLLGYSDDHEYFNLKHKRWIKQQELDHLIISSIENEEVLIPAEKIYSPSQRAYWQVWKN